MDLQYTVIDPTGNITLLVTSCVLRTHQPQVAAELLRREKDAEQVGFVEYPENNFPRLQMMGGEFCGNATMSFGTWLCREDTENESRELLLDVSGAAHPVPCTVTPLHGCALGTVSMPLPEKLEECRFPLDGREISLPVVFLPGICHIIAPAGAFPRDRAEALLRTWAQTLPCDAMGLLLLDEEKLSFEPLVYVRGTDTAVWEHGCGSGSAAIVCYLTDRHKASQCLSLKQPGGTIAAATLWENGAIRSLTITGTVKLGKQKVADIRV